MSTKPGAAPPMPVFPNPAVSKSSVTPSYVVGPTTWVIRAGNTLRSGPGVVGRAAMVARSDSDPPLPQRVRPRIDSAATPRTMARSTLDFIFCLLGWMRSPLMDDDRHD